MTLKPIVLNFIVKPDQGPMDYPQEITHMLSLTPQWDTGSRENPKQIKLFKGLMADWVGVGEKRNIVLTCSVVVWAWNWSTFLKVAILGSS